MNTFFRQATQTMIAKHISHSSPLKLEKMHDDVGFFGTRIVFFALQFAQTTVDGFATAAILYG